MLVEAGQSLFLYEALSAAGHMYQVKSQLQMLALASSGGSTYAASLQPPPHWHYTVHMKCPDLQLDWAAARLQDCFQAPIMAVQDWRGYHQMLHLHS